MKALWSGLYKCISPRDFKITIGKINEQFSGYDQQDSQELLLFLMDGLHEDLNKVRRLATDWADEHKLLNTEWICVFCNRFHISQLSPFYSFLSFFFAGLHFDDKLESK